MSAISIVVKLLEANAAAKALSKYVYPYDAPQEAAKPYFVVNVASEMDELTLQGAGEYERTRVSVECVAATATLAEQMSTAAKVALGNVIKQQVIVGSSRFKDVDVTYANFGLSDSASDRSAYVRTRHFYCRWRAA